MENAIVKKDEMQFSLDDVKKYIAPGATDKELFVFMNTARAYGLNPMKREIHFIKYSNSSPASIVVGYETYLKRAERTGKLDGWRVWLEKDDIGEKAIIEIKRKDFSEPFRWEVYRKEFDKGQANWRSMGTFMLKKVAISQGMRLAFPDELGGMPFIPEELHPDDIGGMQYTTEVLPVEVRGVQTSEDLAKLAEVTPQEEPPQETKHYSLHPQEAKDVPASLGDEAPDPEELVRDLKASLATMMKGFSKEEKKSFYQYVMKGKVENPDNLQDFRDRYMEYRDQYLKAQVPG